MLFGALRRRLTSDVKVVQLAGYVSEHAAYHHGEASLHTTIIHMAQNFVGANNVPLLVPSGQFGTRHCGGRDAASPRYLFTRLDDVTRLLFPEPDDPLLNYLEDDGLSVEPDFFVPVVPLILLNGADGLGTGWSTSVPPYNPLDVLDNVRRAVVGESLRPMHPWFRGFTGRVIALSDPSSNVRSETDDDENDSEDSAPPVLARL